MRCKSCDYPLWSIRARQCPECGAGFVPSDFEFAVNAVEFRCPHCEQRYYGTGERGHLVPRAFECVGCGRPVDMDEMVMFPAEGISEEQTTVPILAWLDKRKKWTAGWRVIGMAMTQPRRMMDVTPVESSVGRAWWFYTLVMALVSILSGVALMLVGLGAAGGVAMALLVGLASFVLGLYGWPLVWGAVAHGLMKLLGAGPRHGIGRTYQGLCYSSGVMLPSAFPCVGLYLVPLTSIWWMVSAALAVPRGQGARAGRGAVAVVLLPAVLWVGAAGLATWGIMQSMRFAATARSQALLSGGTWRVVGAIRGYAATHNGVAPAHMIDLVEDGTLPIDAFVSAPSITRPAGMQSVKIGRRTVGEWMAMSAPEVAAEAAWVRQAAGGAGGMVPAHRVGDVVFTYGGVNVQSPQDPDLWVLMVHPDPDSGATAATGEVVVATAGMGSESFPIGDLGTELQAQNTLRAAYGLAPLPDPSTLHCAAPASGAGGGNGGAP